MIESLIVLIIIFCGLMTLANAVLCEMVSVKRGELIDLHSYQEEYFAQYVKVKRELTFLIWLEKQTDKLRKGALIVAVILLGINFWSIFS